MTIDLEKPRDP